MQVQSISSNKNKLISSAVGGEKNKILGLQSELGHLNAQLIGIRSSGSEQSSNQKTDNQASLAKSIEDRMNDIFLQLQERMANFGKLADSQESVSQSPSQASNDQRASTPQAGDKSDSSAAPSSFVSQVPGGANTNEDSGAGNANCGPACLLMAGRMFGKAGGGGAEADGQIEEMRGLMGADPNEQNGTSTDQLVQGAQKMGLNAKAEKGGVNEVEQALNQGEKAIVNVNPKAYGGADAAHFAVVTAIEGDKVTLFDPAQQKPITISKSELQGAMDAMGNNMVKVGET